MGIHGCLLLVVGEEKCEPEMMPFAVSFFASRKKNALSVTLFDLLGPDGLDIHHH